jgi:hypothetical protein
MGISSPLAPHAAANSPVLRARKIEKQLQRFSRRYRKQIVSTAQLHTAFADLALSFPALLFVISVQHPHINTAELKQLVISGQSLKTLSAKAKLPLWSRKLQPEAFNSVIGPLPKQDIYARQIVNHLPRRSRHAASWLQNVMNATASGDEAFAVWISRECGTRLEYVSMLRKLALWAWFSLRPQTQGHHFVAKAWRPQMKLNAARAAANEWHGRLCLHITIADAVLEPQWLQGTSMDGYDFVPLLCANAIYEEARIMENCVRSYGADIAKNEERLWSVRKFGKRLATLSVGIDYDLGLLSITQIKASKNKKVSRDTALAAMRWFRSQDTLSIEVKPKEWESLLPNRQAWVTAFKPYWLDKGHIPAWLPLAPTQRVLERFAS